MFNIQSYQPRPALEEYRLRNKDLVRFEAHNPTGQKKFPKREICLQALQRCGFSQGLAGSGDRSGGNGTVSFTTDGAFAIRRGCDEKARIPECNEVSKLGRAVELINSSNPKGFEMNLPIKLFQIVDEDSGEYAHCNIQIFPTVKTKQGLHSIGDVVRNIVLRGTTDQLPYIYALGENLAKFQQTNDVEKNGPFHTGLQHGDFNAGNILINEGRDDREISFTLIDNADFCPNGRLISDLVYFVYFNAFVVPDFSPDQTEKVDRMKRVIQELYKGYILEAHEDVCRAMKEHIFDADRIVESAKADGQYKKDSVNCDVWSKTTAIWSNTFDPAQKKAFDMAYSARLFRDIKLKPELASGVSSLDLSGCTDIKYVDRLVAFSRLESLNLANNKVEAIWPLQTLTQLKQLDLSNISVLANIEPLKTLTALTELNLSNTAVVHVGPLSTLLNLNELNLSKSKVNDLESELHLLAVLQNLNNLNLKRTRVTNNFVRERLKGSLIHWTINNASLKTKIKVRKDVGSGNFLSLRGEGSSALNWQQGVRMTNAGLDLWKWKCDVVTADQLSFKVLINDKQWESGNNHTISRNGKIEYTAQF